MGVTSMTIMLQASMRVIAPLVAGVLYDTDIWLPFAVMGGALFLAFVLEALLIIRVPMLRRKPAASDEKKVHDRFSEAEKDEEVERQEVLQNLYKSHEAMTNALEGWRTKREALLAGKSRKELG